MLTDFGGDNALADHLHSPAPARGVAEHLWAFGRFVGSWHIRWIPAATDSPELEGELHFGWVLGGRAIQDVWMVPGAGLAPPERGFRAFHGSTIRFYDPSIAAWRSTWVEPINARVRKFIGEIGDGDITLTSTDDEPTLRWRFTDVTDNSFTWTGEFSDDGENTWTLEETMLATRVA
jgi:hypothetical protein